MYKRVICAFLVLVLGSVYITPNHVTVNAAERKFQAEGCHAKVYCNSAKEKCEPHLETDVVAAQGWEAVASCPTTNPFAPWAMANIEIGTIIRLVTSTHQVLGISDTTES